MRDTMPSLPDTNTLFQHAACGLLLCTADGTIVQANATFAAGSAMAPQNYSEKRNCKTC